MQLPSGIVHPEYYVLEYPDWVNIIARRRDGMFILAEQYRHGLGEVFTELVAGVIENGETPEVAARRELMEETGYGGGKWQLLTVVSQNPSSADNFTYCFLATDVEQLSELQHLDETEDIAIRILSEQELLDMVLSDTMRQSLMLVPLWKYFALYSKLKLPHV